MNLLQNDTALSIGGLLLIFGGFWGVARFIDWLNQKITSATEPLRLKAAALEAKLEIERDTRVAFERTILQSVPSNQALNRFEEHMSLSIKEMREEMRGDIGALRTLVMERISPAPRQSI